MRERLGQHFLENPDALRMIVSALALVRGDTVIEIGPGRGALTEPLAAESKEKGATLYAIEKDPALVATIADAPYASQLCLIAGDAREEIPVLVRMLEGRTYKIAGNIPYYLTGRLFAILSGLPHKPSRVVFTMQEEVADRLVASVPRMNRLAAAVQVWAEPKIMMRLAPRDFRPRPDVNSAVVSLAKKDNAPADETLDRYYPLLRACFGQPRKTMLNNLASAFPELSRAEIERFLENARIDPLSRPHNVAPDDILRLALHFPLQPPGYNRNTT